MSIVPPLSSLPDELRAALADFQDKHAAAAAAFETFAEVDVALKAVKLDLEAKAEGSNDKQRAAWVKHALDFQFVEIVEAHASADKTKRQTAAAADRALEQLKTLRALLSHETERTAYLTAQIHAERVAAITSPF